MVEAFCSLTGNQGWPELRSPLSVLMRQEKKKQPKIKGWEGSPTLYCSLRKVSIVYLPVLLSTKLQCITTATVIFEIL
jgi:hypothetical protein